MFKDYNTKPVTWKAYEIKPDDVITPKIIVKNIMNSKDSESVLTTSSGEAFTFYHGDTVKAGDWITNQMGDYYHYSNDEFCNLVTVE